MDASLATFLAALLAFGAAVLGVSVALERLRGRVPAARAVPGARKLLGPFARWGRRLLTDGLERRLRRALVQAGEPGGLTPAEVVGLSLAGAAGLGILATGPVLALGASPPWILLAVLTGFVLPLVWLRDGVKRRHLRISRDLPFQLDLLTLAVEAGLDFVAALAKVVDRGRDGPLRDELALVLKEIRMGKTREEALRGLAERSGHPALSAFAGALIQADRMGANLGGVLRVQASQLRNERSQRAEKLAGEAPVKMLLPLVLFLFPTVFLVLLGPIVFALATGAAGGLP
jgi:tight adherence protein C